MAKSANRKNMDKRMEEKDSEAQFHKSLKELRHFSSQLYLAADYCKTAFLNSQDKTQILETTKEYVERAVVVVVDHLGTISANLECCISKNNSVSETELKIERLRQRIGTCQIYSYRISMPRFQWGADFSRFHSHYVCSSSSKDSSDEAYLVESGMSRKNVVFAPLHSSRNCTLLKGMDDDDDGDGLSILPKTSNLVFQFEEVEKLKRGARSWKVLVQNKDIAALIKRGRRLLA
ncbi:probable protein ABIL4 isoform X2 [Salvia hispanica]|uniref:probable protein ABIL4 isoform X2 n=1 Tax=Salvia hispanica TaxID=49212 RepID=UPI0020092D83|nr:probable protein ABIL4 isoform X2 [Salvia hispanica]